MPSVVETCRACMVNPGCTTCCAGCWWPRPFLFATAAHNLSAHHCSILSRLLYQSTVADQTWVLLPTVKLIYGHRVVVKESRVSCRRQARSPGSCCFKDPKLPKRFQAKVFKDRGREGCCVCVCMGTGGCVISSWTFF